MSVKLTKARQTQPLAELTRKAEKSRRRGGWTQEEIDLSMARAHHLFAGVIWDDDLGRAALAQEQKDG